MNEEGRWITTRYGNRVFIKNKTANNYMNNKIRNSVDDKGQKYKYVTEEEVNSEFGKTAQEELDKMDDDSLMEIYYEIEDGDDSLETRMLREEVRTRSLSGKSVAKQPELSFDGIQFYDKSDANDWLNQKISEYGNTYYFSSEDRNKLNKLIEKFGNTYFWRR